MSTYAPPAGGSTLVYPGTDAQMFYLTRSALASDFNAGTSPFNPVATLAKLKALLIANPGSKGFMGPGVFLGDLLGLPTVALEGAGQGITEVKLPDGANTHVVTNGDLVNGNPSMTFNGFSINGNKANQSGSGAHKGMFFTLTPKLTVTNVEIYNTDGAGFHATCLGNVTRPLGRIQILVHDTTGVGAQISAGSRDMHNEITAINCANGGVLLDASEMTTSLVKAYGCAVYGIKVNNVFACNLHGLDAFNTINGPGILVVGMVNSIGGGWQSHNSYRQNSGGGPDILFDDDGSQSYGVTDDTEINGIKCGPVNAADPWGGGLGGVPTETFGMTVNAGITGNVRLLSVSVVPGLTGDISVADQSVTGNLIITDFPNGTNRMRVLRGGFSSARMGGNDPLTAANITFDVGAGTGPTLTSVVGDEVSGVITFVTGTAPSTGNVTVLTITWPHAKASKVPVVFLPANTTTSGKFGTGGPFWAEPLSDNTKAVLNIGSLALAATTTYKLLYHVLGGN